jgi:hypothetical protein
VLCGKRMEVEEESRELWLGEDRHVTAALEMNG